MTPSNSCNESALQSLLSVPEDSRELVEAAKHVDGCAHCQRRLAELAGTDHDWHEARDCLEAFPSLDPFDGESSLAATRWNAHFPVHRPIAWSDSMAEHMLAPPSHPEMLGRIGRYEVERLIGAGGMGVVFKAFDTELNRPVAIKILAPHLTVSGAARQRFAREARAAAAIVHEHVVAIHNVETNEKAPFLVMQYVAGESLQSRLDRDGPLDLCEILRISMQTAAALAAAHAQGLVHRDVKPSNILLEKGIERTLLTDFGLARANDDASLTHTGFHPGTPQYMSPEQARGDAVDTRSDLFSLGSVIYTMCTGRPPFRAETGYGILRRITDTEPRPIREINPDIPIWLEGIVAKLHAKSVDLRFTSANEVRELLEQCLAHIQQPTTSVLPPRCSLWTRRITAWDKVRQKIFQSLAPAQRTRTLKRISMAVALIFSLCAVALVFSSSLGLWSPQRDVIWPSTNSHPVDPPDSKLNSEILDSSSSEWNPLENELQEWSRDWQSFEQQTKRLWDPEAIRSQDVTSPNSANQ